MFNSGVNTTRFVSYLAVLTFCTSFLATSSLHSQAYEWGNSGISTWTLDRVSIGQNNDFALRDIHIYSPFGSIPGGAQIGDFTPGIRLEKEAVSGTNNIWDLYAESTNGFRITKEDPQGSPTTALNLRQSAGTPTLAGLRAGLWTENARTNFQIGETRPITFSATAGNNDGIWGAYMGFNAYLAQPSNVAATVTKLPGNEGGAIFATDFDGNVELQTINSNTASEVTDLSYDPQFIFSNEGSFQINSGAEKWTASNWDVTIKSPMSSAWITTETNSNGDHMGIGMTSTGWYFIRSKNAPGATANIDTQCGNYPFYVTYDGRTVTREVQVTLSGWCDFVFDDDYELPELKDVEAHIQQHGHLPGVPSEKQVVENGLELGQMSAIHMQKIEELTLYVIELQKNVEQLRSEDTAIKARLTPGQK